MSSCILPRLAALALSIVLVEATSPAGAALTFGEAEREALARSPSLTARDLATDAARASRIAAGRLPDPRLVVGVDNLPVSGPDRGSLTADFMTMRKVGVMQDFPNRGKREASQDSADAAIARTESERRIDALSIRRAVGLAWSDRYYAEARLALIDAVTDENRLLDIVVRAQIAGGKATALDSLAVEQERAAIDDRRDEMEHEVHTAEARLARYLLDRAYESLSGLAPLQLESTDVASRIEGSPELTLYESLRAVAAADVRAADAAQKPGWGVEVSYAQRGPAYSNLLSVQVNIDLPLFLSTRQGPLLAARRSDLSRVEAEREDRVRDLRSTVDQLLAEYAELRSRVSRVRQVVIALAQRRVDTALDEYRAGRVELPQVVAARREKVETQLKAIELEQRLSQVVIRLNTVIDKDSP